MAEEVLDWLFIDNLPMLFEKRRVARQTQVEKWLDLAQVVRELGIEHQNTNRRTPVQMDYVV
jgi:hypothetical protein